jgi:predicted MFS family arabinose efflux permease
MTLIAILLMAAISLFSFTGIWAAYGFLMGLFFSNGMRSVTMVNLFTRIPDANNRGRYQALQNTVQQVGTAVGSYLGAMAVYTHEGEVHGLERVVGVMALFGVFAMILLVIVERYLNGKSARKNSEPPLNPGVLP